MTDTPYRRFATTVDREPAAVAIDLGDDQVSYDRLHRLVVNASGHIDGLDLPRQSRIGLIAAKELATYVAYLAILRGGHVVVPLGPGNPVSFQETVAGQAKLAAAVVAESTHPELATALGKAGVAILDPAALLRPSPVQRPAAAGRPPDIAYTLFTSGSTGRPKGVPISNANVLSYLDRVVPRYRLGPGARLSHAFELTFDPSVFDLLGAWTSGATLVVPRRRELLLPASYVQARRITHWYSVPSLISYARRIGNLRPGAMPALQWSMFIGESLAEQQARAWLAAAPASIVENVYGPTELTVSCAEYRIPARAEDWPVTSNGTVPIGRVYPGLDWALVDGDRVVDDEGELCVRGPQRFAGYLDPAGNAERFVRLDHGVATRLRAGEAPSAGHWYRTGDRVRRHGADLVQLGRIDRQVKVSGYRIELSDVEGAIRRHPAVRDAAVLIGPNGSGELELRAILAGEEAAGASIRDYLRGQVPGYMIPASFGWLTELPLNSSGKVDYLALRELAWSTP